MPKKRGTLKARNPNFTSTKLSALVCVTMKKNLPDELQAQQATPAILQVSSSKHNAKKITTRVKRPVVCVCVWGGGGGCMYSECMHAHKCARASESGVY